MLSLKRLACPTSLNDFFTRPTVGEVSWYIWWMLLLLAAPLWLGALALLFLWDLVTLRLWRSQSQIPADDKKAVLITDAEAPYGAGLAKDLALMGWTVYAGCATQQGMDAFREPAFARGEKGEGAYKNKRKVITIHLDVTKPDTIAAAATRIGGDFPDTGLFALVHTAVAIQGGMAEWLTPEEYRRVCEVNYLGVVSVTLAMVPLLKRCRGSRIISHSSVSSLPPAYPLLSAFAGACHASMAFLSALRLELSPWKVHVSTVITGFPPSHAGGVLAKQAVGTLTEAWTRLDKERKEAFGEDFGDECTHVLLSMTEEAWLRPRHVISGLMAATLAFTPSANYYVGLDSIFLKGILRALPPRMRDAVIWWFTGEQLTPASVLIDDYETNVADDSTVLSEDDDPLCSNPNMKEASLCKCRGKLQEEFEVLEVLGKGAFAEVRKGKPKPRRKAKKPTVDTNVALKFIKEQALIEPKMKTALKREIAIMSQLSSHNDKNDPGVANIMGFFGYFEDPRSLVMVLEFLSGGDLFDNVLKEGHFSERRASLAIEQLMHALLTCHSKGIIHRDIKPENLVYGGGSTGEMVLKLADFGLAISVRSKPSNRNVGSHSFKIKTQQLAGTPMYMAPEIIEEREYSPACDIWASGVVLYILLVGEQPFSGRTHRDLFHEITKRGWSFDSKLWDSVSDSAKEAVTAMMTRDPEKRVTAAQVLNMPFIKYRDSVPDGQLGNQEGIRALTAKARFKAVARICIANVRVREQKIENDRTVSTAMSILHISPDSLAKVKVEFDAEAGGSEGGLDKEQFIRVMKKVGWESLPLERVFELFDIDNSGKVDKRELLLGLNKLDANSEEGWRFCFKMLDADGSGTISYDELARVLINHHRVKRAVDKVEHGEKVCTSALDACHAVDCDPETFELSEAIAELFAEIDVDRNGEISLQEFLEGARRRPDLMQTVLGEKLLDRRRSSAPIKLAGTTG